MDYPPYFWEEEKAWCPFCKAPHEMVRPGKTQPTCDCHLKCDYCGDKLVYHGEGQSKEYPNMRGDWCDKCGPFPAAKSK